MADKRITANTEITYNQVNATDVLLVGQVTTDKKITLPLTKKYVLLNKSIGGNTPGDIVTTNGTQTLSGKRINSLKLNSDTAIITDSTEINLLDGLTAQASLLNILDGATVTTALLNILDGVTSTTALLNILDGVTVNATKINYLTDVTGNVQTQLNNKIPQYSTTYPISIPYTKTFTASGTTYNIADTTILTDLSLSTLTQCFNGKYLNSTLYSVTGATLYLSVNQEIKLAVTDNGGSNVRILTITYSGLTSGSVYMACMELKLATRNVAA